MGNRYPNSLAAMRGIKAEGGWAVVCTEEAEIHHSADLSPYNEGRIWDAQDIPALARMTEAVHAHGSLAGIELVHGGNNAVNRFTRDAPLTPSDVVIGGYDPVHARAMDKQDIANVRRWHRQAALRSREAGFDIVYVYAGHDMTILQHFLSRRWNQRTDEYGGSLENRVRLFREVLEDTKEAVGDTCVIAVRFAVDELLGSDGITAENEGREVIEMLAELPDLWDVNISGWPNDSQTARFSEEGYQEPYIKAVKSLTTKPVVGVGRYIYVSRCDGACHQAGHDGHDWLILWKNTVLRERLSDQAFCVCCGAGKPFADLRRFWAVAARRNSSFAPQGPGNRNLPRPRRRLRWAKSLSTFFPSFIEMSYWRVLAISRATWRATWRASSCSSRVILRASAFGQPFIFDGQA